jgi:nicotinamidase-related amidase
LIPHSLTDFVAPGNVALVMWDWQNGLAGKALDTEKIQANAQLVLASAERAKIPVIWSRHVLPPLDLIPKPFKAFLMKKQRVEREDQLVPTMHEGMDETAFLPGFQPAAHHIVLEKSAPSLFVDTPLDARLKTLGVTTLVLTGVATDIGIEFTARHAAALGYFSVVIEDATGSYTREAQESSLNFLRRWITPVVPAADVCRIWDAAAGGGAP